MPESVAISRDARFGVEVVDLGDRRSMGMLATIMIPVVLRLEPQGKATWIRLLVSPFWLKDYRPSWYDWELSMESALQELVYLAVGEYLDANGMPSIPEGDEPIADIELSSVLPQLKNRSPASNPEILLYLAGLLAFSDRFRKGSEQMTPGDFLRLNTPARDFDHVVRRYNDVYWRPITMGRRYEPTNRLLEQFESGVLPGFRSAPVFQVQRLLEGSRYEAVRHHFDQAIEELRGDSPNLPTAAKEAINALESLAKITTGRDGGTFGDCIKTLRKKGLLRPPLDKIFEAISGYRGVTPGVGHGSVQRPDVTMTEAGFIINAVAASMSFLVELDREFVSTGHFQTVAEGNRPATEGLCDD